MDNNENHTESNNNEENTQKKKIPLKINLKKIMIKSKKIMK